MSFSTDTRVSVLTGTVATGGPIPGGPNKPEDDQPTSGTMVAKDGSEKKVSLWNRFSNWCSNHKREIAIALIIIGIALALTGIGLAVGAACAGVLTVSVLSVKAATAISGATTLTLCGKLVITGSAIAGTGGIAVGVGTGVLLGMPKKPHQPD